jgi:hypothetical protein
MVGDVKQEESENIQQAGYILGDGIKVNFELQSFHGISSLLHLINQACMKTLAN